MANTRLYQQELAAGTIPADTSLGEYTGTSEYVPTQENQRDAAQTFTRQVDPKAAYDAMNRYSAMIANQEPIYEDEVRNANADWDSLGLSRETYPDMYNKKINYAGPTRPAQKQRTMFDRFKKLF